MHFLYWFLAVAASVAAGVVVYRADVRRSVPQPWLTASLRSLLVFLTLLLMLAPSLKVTQNETVKPVVVFLQDNSQSVSRALGSDSATYTRGREALLERLDKDYRVVRWGFGDHIQQDTLSPFTQSATDISKALSQATERFGQQNLSAIILASDGRYNQGADPLYMDLPFQGALYTVAIGDTSAQKDVRMGRVYANKVVTRNSQFEVRADLIAQMCAGYKGVVRLREDNEDVAASVPLSVSSDHFDRSVTFTVHAEQAGIHHYIVEASAADGEQNLLNNRKDVFVEVIEEKKQILIAAHAPHPDVNALREALQDLGEYDVIVKTGDQVPADFSKFAVVMLHGLPAQAQALPQLSSARAVWFIVAGGSNSAALSEAEHVARLNVNPFNLQPQFARPNASFNAFSLPQNMQAVLDKMPPLASPAGRAQAAPDAMVLFESKGNEAQPLWMMRGGLRPEALLLGEGLWRWRLFEYRFLGNHNVVDEAIRKTVGLLAAQVNDKPFRVETSKFVWSDQEPISLSGWLLNQSNEQVNTPDVQLTLSDSSGTKQSYLLERSGNIYHLNIGSRAQGSYQYVATVSYNGRRFEDRGRFVVRSLPLEQMETGADYALLYHLSGQYSGHVFPASGFNALGDSILANQNIRPVIQSSTESLPLIHWKWYFILLLLIAVAEWLLRKYWLAQ